MSVNYIPSDIPNLPIRKQFLIAKELGIKGFSRLPKEVLTKKIQDILERKVSEKDIEVSKVKTHEAKIQESKSSLHSTAVVPAVVQETGVLEILEEGFGFLRTKYTMSSLDIYVSPAYIRKLGLRTGDTIICWTRPPRVQTQEKYPALAEIISVNGMKPDEVRGRPRFESLTPIFPREQLILETDSQDLATRLVDLIAPIGRGQRGLIVAPPKAGKTTIIKKIAQAVTKKYGDVLVIILLVDERPEEVTDIRRSVEKAEVVSSTFDLGPENHVRVAELTLEKAKRLVEIGRHVVILLDGITRMTRAYNNYIPPSGRTLSGGLDPASIQGPKRFFGAARNVEFGGSLTILATALVETGSRMDEVIFEEFKGTGNMELVLDRKLAERRLFPAINVQRSGTRHEELLYSPDDLEQIYKLRRLIADSESVQAMDQIINLLRRTRSNREFFQTLSKVGM
ncbi:MAG: Transcription termination factor Rho [candidate division WS2 bacterium]|uniref:Transcription termination factor Rho n=1 Tax=Psychracetigena formicireducens TaxID=2986056 RepID=A0A9E2BFZ3_PSYF1|nr:Transcription termination factor Rho [Candidatus Psychracetigena formicireducens]MBT9144274.1 Transcription termination factor Rho [Candidatus Psychracetigena formicireducens]